VARPGGPNLNLKRVNRGVGGRKSPINRENERGNRVRFISKRNFKYTPQGCFSEVYKHNPSQSMCFITMAREFSV